MNVGVVVLSGQDLDMVQHQLANDYRLELVNGEVRVMSPSGYQSDEVASEFSAQLRNWIRPRQLGRVTGAGAGFTLPNTNIRSPDVSFVRAERLRTSPTRFAEIAPDLVVEVKSPSDSLTALRTKVDDFLQQGSLVGIVINPEQRWLKVRREGQDPVLFQDDDSLFYRICFQGIGYLRIVVTCVLIRPLAFWDYLNPSIQEVHLLALHLTMVRVSSFTDPIY